MATLCNGEPIWDANLVWNTSTPVISRCLQRTLPIWIPSAILFAFAPFQVFYILHTLSASIRPQSIPLNFFNICRLLLVAVITFVNAIQLVYSLVDYVGPSADHPVSKADLIADVLNVLTFTLLGFLLHLHRVSGVHTSALVTLFTFLATCLALPTVYMYARYFGDEHIFPDPLRTGANPWSAFELTTFAVHFAALVILCILTSFADSPVKKKKCAKSANANSSEDSCGSSAKPLLSQSQTPPQSDPQLSDCPEQFASFLSTLTYFWIDPLILKGFRRALSPSDLWRLNRKETSAYIAPKFQVKAGERFGTVRAISRSYGWFFLSGSAFRLAFDLLQFVGPQLLKIFISFISSPSSAEPLWHGFLYAAAFFVIASLQAILLNYHYQTMYHVGMRVRAGLIASIYRKSLCLSNGARREATTGSITNLMSVDAQRLVDTFPNINNVWAAPLQISLTMYFLWIELGVSVLAGLGVMLAMMPLNGWISSVQRRYQIVQMKKKDERVKVVSEMLGGVKVIKLYGWEVPFIGRISAIRSREIEQLRTIAYVKAITNFVWTCAPFAVTFVTFAVYVSLDEANVLDPSKAWVSLALFELLRIPLTTLPDIISSVVMATVAIGRLDRFLNSEELEKYVTREEDEKCAIRIEDGTFKWEKGTQKATLAEVTVRIPKGALVAVVGHVGAGKSSLLSAILGDMERVEGSVNVARGESVAYVAQQAWIRNATLRENVLFGAAYEKKRYEAIIEMCALKPDLAILPGGDQTEIGEKGINLSGGQKQRVALARACYQASSIVLLDDPLAAVDSHVARHIFTQVLHSTTGYLRDRTRVLVTNNIQLLPEVDQIFVLESGRIRETGTYSQLMANSGKFADFIKEYSSLSMPESPPATSNATFNLELPPSCFTLHHQRSPSSVKSASTATLPAQSQLIKAEHTESGNVATSVYLKYLASLTCPWLTLVLLGYTGMQAASVATNVWLAIWSNDKPTTTNGTVTSQADIELRNYRLTIYGLLGLSQGIIFLAGAFAFAKGTVNSSVTLHRSLLECIMRAPMKFFDTTPLGRIVNRFSKDIDTLDNAIPISFNGLLLYLLQVLATIILICVSIPLFMAVVGPIVLLYYFIQKFYVPTARQLKRLESVTRSPIFSHFAESLAGESTIRAFARTEQFIAESHRRVDSNIRCFYPKFIANRWLAFRLKFCGNLIVLFAAVFAVLSRQSFQSAPGFVGLVMTYSLSVTQILNWLVRQSSDMEANAVSVERIEEWTGRGGLESEGDWTRPDTAKPNLPQGWPLRGEVEFVSYSVRYRPGLDLVLKNVSVKISAGMKAAVVGRTGSGKTTLSLALFRILEAASGQVLIDGIDTAKLGLHELRHRLAIIPQDPVLFSGTIRSNLDPFGYYSDQRLWKALEHCYLKEYITSQEDGLNMVIVENGSNLSVGQRQLLCLGRALLRHAKILVLDEATGSIDLETDSLIQQTIRREFAQCTVLTIAHRLHTIIDSDRVMVLDGGRIIEFDSPASLLANHESQFYSLAKDAGIV